MPHPLEPMVAHGNLNDVLRYDLGFESKYNFNCLLIFSTDLSGPINFFYYKGEVITNASCGKRTKYNFFRPYSNTLGPK
jgi:hypothetical protein